MLDSLAWLALEVKFLDPAVAFYTEELDMTVARRTDTACRLPAGETDLILRRPSAVPRGGLHTHFAFEIPAAEYDDWFARLEHLDPSEFVFGEARSLYCYDPDGNCVELGQSDVDGPGIDGIFEVVLEVESLDDAEAFYRDLGFSVVDRGGDRRRVRLAGAVDLELWEPQLGIADARGGVHVDVGFAGDADAAVAAVGDRAERLVEREDGVQMRDPDGHWLTVRRGP